MTELELRIEPDEGLDRLKMYHQGIHIGDYERSIDACVDLERQEAGATAHLLLDAHERHGKIMVPWNSSDRIKEIRTYREHTTAPGYGGTIVGCIPKAYWTRRKR